MCLKDKVIEDLSRAKFESCKTTEDQIVFLDYLRNHGQATIADDLESEMSTPESRMESMLEKIREHLPV